MQEKQREIKKNRDLENKTLEFDRAPIGSQRQPMKVICAQYESSATKIEVVGSIRFAFENPGLRMLTMCCLYYNVVQLPEDVADDTRILDLIPAF